MSSISIKYFTPKCTHHSLNQARQKVTKWWRLSFFSLFDRIVRNKAAERAKVNYTSQQQTSESPSAVSQSSGGSGANNVMSTAAAGGSQQQQQQQLAAAAHMGHPHESSLLRPSYSINGILGIPQPDANANNINKRKRDEEGTKSPSKLFFQTTSSFFKWLCEQNKDCRSTISASKIL